jgi:hypothetical protein
MSSVEVRAVRKTTGVSAIATTARAAMKYGEA